MSLITNKQHIDSIIVNEQVIDSAFMNKDLFYRREMTIALPKMTTAFTLENILKNASLHGRTRIRITNSHVQPMIMTGNIGNYEITFENKSGAEIQATGTSAAAFVATSPITLINYGYIRGAGGHGGTGGKGANSTKTTEKTDKTGHWKARWGISNPMIEITDGSLVFRKAYSKNTVQTYRGWITATNGKKYYRDASPTGQQATTASGYTVTRKYTVKSTITGGAGGSGGQGQSFGKPAGAGQAGKSSSPSGGHAGSRGGDGGSWGVNGKNGHNGTAGQIAGPSISGKSFLQTGSETGLVNGSIK